MSCNNRCCCKPADNSDSDIYILPVEFSAAFNETNFGVVTAAGIPTPPPPPRQWREHLANIARYSQITDLQPRPSAPPASPTTSFFPAPVPIPSRHRSNSAPSTTLPTAKKETVSPSKIRGPLLPAPPQELRVIPAHGRRESAPSTSISWYNEQPATNTTSLEPQIPRLVVAAPFLEVEASAARLNPESRIYSPPTSLEYVIPELVLSDPVVPEHLDLESSRDSERPPRLLTLAQRQYRRSREASSSHCASPIPSGYAADVDTPSPNSSNENSFSGHENLLNVMAD